MNRKDNKTSIESLLSALKRAQASVSGAQLASAAGVSRTALWKRAQTLRRLGYEIDAERGVGYRLVGIPDRLYPWEVRDGLHTKRFGQSVHHFLVTGSTQDETRRLAEAGAPEGTLVVAEEQRSPRGRLGRSYHTPPGGIWFSLLLRPRRSPQDVIHLSLLAAVAVQQAIALETGLRLLVRWPNDLLAEGRKVVGIAVELASEQDVLHYVVLGVGVNVNLKEHDFPPELRPIATSLRQLLGSDVARAPLLRRILERTEALYDGYLQDGRQTVLDAWRALPTILGQRVFVQELADAWQGTAVDLDDSGALLVRTDDGTVRRVLAGDVRVSAGSEAPR